MTIANRLTGVPVSPAQPRPAVGAVAPVKEQAPISPSQDATALHEDDDTELLALLEAWNSEPTPSADDLRSAADEPPQTLSVTRQATVPDSIHFAGEGEAFISSGPRTTTWKPEDGIASGASLAVPSTSWRLFDDSAAF